MLLLNLSSHIPMVCVCIFHEGMKEVLSMLKGHSVGMSPDWNPNLYLTS